MGSPIPATKVYNRKMPEFKNTLAVTWVLVNETLLAPHVPALRKQPARARHGRYGYFFRCICCIENTPIDAA